MENVIGITGKDFVLLAGSRATARGPTLLSKSTKRVHKFNNQTMIAAVGEAGDLANFVDYAKANVALSSFRNAFELEPAEVAEYIRSDIADSLRTGKMKMVNLLVGGVNERENYKPSLHYIDYLGSIAKVPYAAHGYAQYYCLSLLDKHHHANIDQERAIELLQMCLKELDSRLPIDFKGMRVRIIYKGGVRTVQPSEYGFDKEVEEDEVDEFEIDNGTAAAAPTATVSS